MNRRASAFTLIELLLAVAVFAMVASFATVLLASTVRTKDGQARSQAVAAQGQGVLNQLTDVGMPGTSSELHLLQLSGSFANGYGQNSALFFKVTQKDGTTHLVLYCPESSSSATVHPLVRIQFVASVTSVNAADCSDAPLLVSRGVKDRLTTDTVNVLSFRAWPVWTPTKAPPSDYNVQPPAFSVELVLQYITDGEIRKNGAAPATRLVFHTIIEHNSVFKPSL